MQRIILPVLLFALLLCAAVSASPSTGAYRSFKARGQDTNSSDSLTVDLGYAIYKGFENKTSGLNNFLGIRYAAPPTGANRFQEPQEPAVNRSTVIDASSFAPYCPQSAQAPSILPPCPQLSTSDTLPAECNTTLFKTTVEGDEDCLFLNVYAPSNASKLPVLVWIHGGGYGTGNGRQDLMPIINANDNGFIGVAIQYRLGAFGFMSSDEAYRFGSVNNGLKDQHLALQWVQKYISLFGGDPDRVTISGESAGAGSVMLQDMAYGGTQGTQLFQNSIAASPYLPMQYNYSDWIPTQSYFALAATVGCFTHQPYGNSSTTIFDCLVEKNTLVLQLASAIVSTSGLDGTWGFLPVTDGTFIQSLPSRQLQANRVNGLRALVGNNANEGPVFVPQVITTAADFNAYVRRTLPLFTPQDIAILDTYYPGYNDSANSPRFATTGTDPSASALNVSTFATGQQQRADNLYAETTFVCPAYWLANAYASGNTSTAYRYQFSVPPAYHGADNNVYFGPRPVYASPDFALAFMRIWGNFVVRNDPNLDSLTANGNSTGNDTAGNPATAWPPYSSAAPIMLNLNETGGVPSQFEIDYLGFPAVNVSDDDYSAAGPPLRNEFALVNALTWEAGRGARCDFWRRMGQVVPE